MNKLFLIILGLVLFAALPVSAGPFLVCDAYPSTAQVDLYQVELNGQVVPVEPDPTGQCGFKYDLASKPDGSYTVRARAHNSKGWSAWCPAYNFSLPHNLPSR